MELAFDGVGIVKEKTLHRGNNVDTRWLDAYNILFGYESMKGEVKRQLVCM